MTTREHLTARYELIEEIGRGGQGQMFLARDREQAERGDDPRA